MEGLEAKHVIWVCLCLSVHVCRCVLFCMCVVCASCACSVLFVAYECSCYLHTCILAFIKKRCFSSGFDYTHLPPPSFHCVPNASDIVMFSSTVDMPSHCMSFVKHVLSNRLYGDNSGVLF